VARVFKATITVFYREDELLLPDMPILPSTDKLFHVLAIGGLFLFVHDYL